MEADGISMLGIVNPRKHSQSSVETNPLVRKTVRYNVNVLFTVAKIRFSGT
jgi:hypothetical protein